MTVCVTLILGCKLPASCVVSTLCTESQDRTDNIIGTTYAITSREQAIVIKGIGEGMADRVSREKDTNHCLANPKTDPRVHQRQSRSTVL